METWSFLAAGGLWLALPVTGFWCCRALFQGGRRGRWSPLARWGLATAVGVAVWSLPMLLSAELGLYRPWALGLAGWGIVLAFLLRWRKLHRSASSKNPEGSTDPGSVGWDRWEAVLGLGLVLAGGLLWSFPSESVLGGVDQGVYANVGVFLANGGHLEIPFPSHDLEDPAPAYERLPGFRIQVEGNDGPVYLVPQFAHLFPVWLAQAHGTLGLPGLLRLNGLLALIALACFFATASALVPRPMAVVATLFLAFNPAQLWVARITLSETLAQVLVWASLSLLVRLDGQIASARWAGFSMGLIALARVDGFVFLPLILLAHGAAKIFGRSKGDPWPALYQTAIPTFAAAAASYALWSPFYLEGMMRYLAPVGVVTLGALYPVLALTPGLRSTLRRWVGARWVRVAVVVLLAVVAVWAYAIRPIPQPTEEENRQWYAAQQAAEEAGVAAPAPREVDWGRNTLPNLGRYLSPLVVLLALLGVGWGLWRTLGLRMRVGMLSFLVVWGGFTFAYLYDPAVDPLHFWAIRRFVPLVLPGFVLVAALGWRWVARRLPNRPRVAVAVGLTLALGAHTAWVSGPLAFFSRDGGVVEQLRQVAEQLPEETVTLVPTFRQGWAQWATPLHFVFERRLHPFDPASTRRLPRVLAWIERQRDAGQAVYLLAEDGTMPADCCPAKELVGRFPLRRQVLERTFWPVPRSVRGSEQWLEIHRLPARPVNDPSRGGRTGGDPSAEEGVPPIPKDR